MSKAWKDLETKKTINSWKRNNPTRIPRKDWEYLLGVLHGDGYLYKNSMSITIGHQAKGFLYSLKSIIEKNFGLRVKIYNRKSAYYLFVNSKVFVETFKKYKHKGLWTLPALKYPGAYLSGLIDTDGSVAKLKKGKLSGFRVSIYQKSNGNLRQILPLFERLEIRYKFIENYKYTNKLGTFMIDTVIIRGKNDICLLASKINLLYTKKANRLKKAVIKYKTMYPKRINGVLEKQITQCIKKGIINSKQLIKELGLTSGNFSWQVQHLMKKNFLTRKRKILDGKLTYNYYLLS